MKLLLSLLFVGMTTLSFSQTDKKVETLKFDTSAECGSCKKRIEGKLNYTKGIKFAELDVPTKVLTVKFKTADISAEEIKKTVADVGYDCGDVKANKKAYAELPGCCKVGGMIY
jgi:mercuric ion binding protein